eukprot:TRINITY_DN12608_c0_g1_i1.p1 TRINITY_DN12608_c0_g1~~TRINITY_DN12608_c0_g1_i1.p1  ORF type:complete len:67 (-),score=2.43 TRINITY_DN12608_c0_g1_i1:125-325(-)
MALTLGISSNTHLMNSIRTYNQAEIPPSGIKKVIFVSEGGLTRRLISTRESYTQYYFQYLYIFSWT